MRIQFALILTLLTVLAGGPVLAREAPGGEPIPAAQLLQPMTDSGVMMLDGSAESGFEFSLLLVPDDIAPSAPVRGLALNVWTDRFGEFYGQFRSVWRVAGDALCVQLIPTAYLGSERCVYHFRQSDGSYQAWAADSARLVWTVRVRPLQPAPSRATALPGDWIMDL